MIYNAFLDDSKDKGAKRIMVSAGFFGRECDWLPFRIEWRRVLGKHGLEYYKSSECFAVDGQFRRLRKDKYPTDEEREQAQAIRGELQAIVGNYPNIRAVGIAIQLEHYRKMAALPEASAVLPSDPYEAALSSVMFETVKCVRCLSKHSMVTFVHDDDNETYFESLRRTYKEFYCLNKKTAKFMGGFQPMDYKKTPALQLADLIASHTTFLAGKHLELDSEAQVEMSENISRLGVWDENYIRGVLKHGLIKKGKPIPFDLS